MAGRWWRLVVVVGVVGAVGEALLAVSDPSVLVFAAIFAVGAALAYKRKLAGVVIVGLMSFIEAAFVPFYPRDSTQDIVVQVAFGILGVVGVVAAIAAVRERRRAGSPA